MYNVKYGVLALLSPTIKVLRTLDSCFQSLSGALRNRKTYTFFLLPCICLHTPNWRSLYILCSRVVNHQFHYQTVIWATISLFISPVLTRSHYSTVSWFSADVLNSYVYLSNWDHRCLCSYSTINPLKDVLSVVAYTDNLEDIFFMIRKGNAAPTWKGAIVFIIL